MTGVPLKHQQISRTVAREIRTGRSRAGERLPGEHALARRFGVSRTTVRAALADLSAQGLIATRTGKGSYVLFDGRPPDDRPGRARVVTRHGGDGAVRTLAVHETRDSALAAELRLDEDMFVCVERTALAADGTVLTYERSFLPPVPGIRELPAQRPGAQSPAEALLRAGLRPDHGEQRMGGRPIDAREAEALRRAPGDWFLELRRTSRAVDGSFVEHLVSLLDPARCHLAAAFG
ncbi:GntR family transcriptional regulator [Streptomyces sp. NPDC127190]|uniref:GntR family transcriptional regulator n=1 Tax=unclassified Streptomyces TaxID=2593676 RepID=UPI003636EF4B